MNEWFGFLQNTAACGLANQKKHDGDFLDENNLLICGKCKEPRQKMKDFQYEEDGEKKTFSLKVTCHCRCEREQDAENEKKEQARREQMVLDRLRKASLMDAQFKYATFDRFEVDVNNKRNYLWCKSYVDRFDEMMKKNQGLLLYGDVGTGKSFAAACIANDLLSKKYPVIMTSFVKILSLIQSREMQDAEILERMEKVDLVIFDDLGAERGTDYALEKVYEIVDGRCRQNLPMIFTTNLTKEAMETESDIRYSRIYDRILGNCYPMEFKGSSWRRAKAGRRYTEMEKVLDG